MRISFCTTVHNRLHQLAQVFDANLQIIRQQPKTEWVILNYNSSDGLDEFMMERLPELSRRVVYACETSGRPWHLSVAKNIAHRLSAGEVLMNLDVDNFIGDAVKMIRMHFDERLTLHLFSDKLGDGTCGRVVIGRRIFEKLGGYDEAFFPMGYQDQDLQKRAWAAGVPYVRLKPPADSAIPNSKHESIKHCRMNGKKWLDFNMANRRRSEANIAAGRLIANVGKEWGLFKGEVQFGQKSLELTPPVLLLALRVDVNNLKRAAEWMALISDLVASPRHDLEFAVCCPRMVCEMNAEALLRLIHVAGAIFDSVHVAFEENAPDASISNLRNGTVRALEAAKDSGRIQAEAVLALEPSSLPLRPDWLEVLQTEWARAKDAGQAAVGDHTPDGAESVQNIETAAIFAFGRDSECAPDFIPPAPPLIMDSPYIARIPHKPQMTDDIIRAIRKRGQIPAICYGLESSDAILAVQAMLADGTFRARIDTDHPF
jgi:hypothetical protein